MKHPVISFVIVIMITTLTIPRTEAKHGIKTQPRNSQFGAGKIFKVLASQLVPSAFHIPKEGDFPRHTLFEEIPGFDLYFMEYFTILLQFQKVTEDTQLPEIDGVYHTEDYCIELFCYDWDVIFKTGRTKISGAQNISVNTEFSSSGFRSSYKIPFFKWSSPDLLFNFTNNEFRFNLKSRDYHMTILNMEMDLSTNFHFVQGLGLQLENLTMAFAVGMFESTIEARDFYDRTGHLIGKLGPEVKDHADTMNNDWRFARETYPAYLQNQLNCILSNNQAHEGCRGEPEVEKYRRMNAIQFFEMMGLGSLTRP